MKGYELLKAISDGEIKNGTKIEIKGRFRGDLEGSYFIYDEGSFVFPIYKPDGTEYYGNVELHDLINFSFKVIEENKEIEELHILDEGNSNKSLYEYCSRILIKQNELIRAVNKINKDLEKGQTLNIEIDEETISNAIKKARNYLEREEK